MYRKQGDKLFNEENEINNCDDLVDHLEFKFGNLQIRGFKSMIMDSTVPNIASLGLTPSGGQNPSNSYY
jgi:hypothetical protein